MVSVVITCYNYDKYIRNAIESVLHQTYCDFEIIIVNDGSTDNSEDIIQPYLRLHKIKYIVQKNAGQANAKNVGISNASGEFVAFLDADDAWEHTKLEKQMVLFKKKSVGVVFSRACYIDANGQKVDHKLESRYLIPRTGNVTDYLIFDNFVPFSSAIVRNECLKRFSTFDESLKMGIDWDLWLRISTAYEFDFVDEPLMHYRLGHDGQMSKNLIERQSCSDRIMHNFSHKYSSFVPPQVLKKAYAYTFCNRGYYLRKTDLAKSNQYFWDAIRHEPAGLAAYKGLLVNMLYHTCTFFH